MRILVIEDEHKITNSIKKGLDQESFTVDVAYNGTDGYDLAPAENYGVIILDLMLPDKWYPLGADMVSPMPGGLGVFIQSRYKDLSPRHASAIAALMYQEGFIDYKDGKPILLRKIKK